VVVREEERDQVVPRLAGYIRSGVPIWEIRRQVSFPDIKPVLFCDVPSYGHIVFCAIARPENFLKMLKEAGVYELEFVIFPDHHAYTADDMNKLVEEFENLVGNGFVTTEKDGVKLSPAMRAQLEAVGPLVVARLDCLFVDEVEVMRALEARIS
jgi:tetraacyldisaccharide 4'-kinase